MTTGTESLFASPQEMVDATIKAHNDAMMALAADVHPYTQSSIDAHETTIRGNLGILLQVVMAADDYRGWTGGHHWRCEFRTAAKGWKKGDPPVIECVCGLDRLNTLLGELGLNV